VTADGSVVLRGQSQRQRLQSLGFAIGIGLCVLLSAGFAGLALGRFGGSEQRFEFDSRVNPNTAPVASLVRLPGIGLAKAAAIVAYRRSVARAGADHTAFEKPQDLQKVKGIGPKTVEKLREFLKFH